jgi:ParB/RepB/Spo0J family partition protein
MPALPTFVLPHHRAAERRKAARRALASRPDTEPERDRGLAPSAPPQAEERLLPLDSVFASPLNPRKSDDREPEGLLRLADNIARNGLLQAILVRPAPFAAPPRGGSAGDERWEIICGARRHRACLMLVEDGRLAADYRIPARIRECDDDELILLAATENLARRDMPPLDEAAVFAALRPRVKPEPGERPEAAIARLVGTSERTVFRRLALLRLVPEAQTRLEQGKLTLAQAQALSLGPPQAQAEVLKRDYILDNPEAIRRHVTGNAERIPAQAALFDLAQYQGEIVADPETGERWLANRAEFLRLQESAIQAKAETLRERWPWVEVHRGDRWWGTTYERRPERKKDRGPECGALIVVRREGLEVAVEAPVVRIADRKAAEKAERSDTGPAAARPPLTEAQVVALHRAKTQALRHAIVHNSGAYARQVPLALAILGLAGVREVAIGRGEIGIHPDLATAGADAARLAELLQRYTLADNPWDIDPAIAFSRLTDAPLDELEELFTRLLAERIGSWITDPLSGIGGRLGDSPLACAIADATQAAAALPAFWQPDEAWFKAYPRSRLEALARALPEAPDARGMKKRELVALLRAQPPGFWSPDRFPEARFQSEAEAARALAAIVTETDEEEGERAP